MHVCMHVHAYNNYYTLSQRGQKPSAAMCLSPAEMSGGKCTHQEAQEVPLTATAGV